MRISVWGNSRKVFDVHKGGSLMDVKFPDLKDGSKYILSGKQSAVLIGANGAGKTRMSVWIEENNQSDNCFVHRISAQKSLTLPERIDSGDIEAAKNWFLFGQADLYNNGYQWAASIGRRSSRWGNDPITHPLADYEPLMKLLFSEDYQFLSHYRYESEQLSKKNESLSLVDFGQSSLQRTIKIAEKVLKNRKFRAQGGFLECEIVLETESKNNINNRFNFRECSDGEREVLYLIGAVVSVPKGSIIIVDEPENHLHRSIILKLWNVLEKEREDCFFLYITHDLDFAKSRNNSQIFWVKEYLGNFNWNYKPLDTEIEMNELTLQLLGTRDNVLLVEGDKGSIDVMLYSRLFSEWTVIPCGSCEQVIKGVKFVREHSEVLGIKVLGIIDRDRLTDSQVEKYFHEDIIVPKVAEVENFFLVEEVFKLMCDHFYVDNKNQVFETIKAMAIDQFSQQMESQILQHLQYQIQNLVNQGINNNSKSIIEFKNKFKITIDDIDFDIIENEIRSKFENIQKQGSYKDLLKYFNFKGLGHSLNSELKKSLNLGYPNYIDIAIRILSQNQSDELSMKLKEAFYLYFEENAIELLLRFNKGE